MMKLGARSVALALAVLVASTALPAAVGTDSVVSVANVAPAVVSVTLPGSTVNPTSGTTTSVSTTIVVSDANGYNDISSVTLQVLKPDGTTSHIAAAAATFSSGTALQATYTKSFNMNFYDDAALTTSTYKVKIVATDSQGATGDNTASLTVFNFAQLAALNLGSSSLNMGSSLSPAAQSSTITLTVQNYGNIQIDAQVSGAAMTHATASASIPVSALAYSLNSDMTSSGTLSTSATTLSTFDLAKGASSTKSTYWKLTVPSGSDQWIPSGTYTGTLTVGAVSG